MKGIGGNITAIIQICTTTNNDIGEHVQTWADVQTVKGWLDLSSGEASYANYNAKIQESTHIFISDYVPLDSRITAETSRMVINGKRFDVLLIDNPMELGTGSQLEFYLKFTGGQ
jgi:head-tail adaptor